MLTRKQESLSTETAQPERMSTSTSQISQNQTTAMGKSTKTRIIVKYDIGFKNTLYIRGKGGNLSWDKGIPMKNTKADEWMWETDSMFPTGEFKVLINDRTYETGPNHPLQSGANIQYTPHF
jgi:hypothetical protein